MANFVLDEVESQDLHDVVLVGHSYSGIPVGQAAERIGNRLAAVVFVDSSLPADGESFVAAWPDGGAMAKASIAENGGFWPPAPAAHFGAEPSDDVAKLLTSEHWRLVEMNTGHWPMFSQPRELTQILLAAC